KTPSLHSIDARRWTKLRLRGSCLYPARISVKWSQSRKRKEEVAGLNTKKSPGADGLEALAIKLLPPFGIQRLTSIFNACLEIGHFPSDWKKAEVILIPKPGKPEADLASYRPISLLSVLSKLLVRVFLRRFQTVLDEAGLIPDHQFGFRRCHATPEQFHSI
ncbi:hypothetical protein KR026_008205, partial [Drosophila bipectinata]